MLNGQVVLTWADGEHTFNIAKFEQVFELEEKCGAGVGEIFDRVRSGRWRWVDVRETVRLALIGGGMQPVPALTLVKRYVDNRPWQESRQVAMAILLAAMVGVEGDNPTKKAEADRGPDSKSTTTMDGSSDPQSMGSAPVSAGRQTKRDTQPSGNSGPA